MSTLTCPFKVGDKVKRFQKGHGGMVPGDVGTIKRIESHWNYSGKWLFFFHEFPFGHSSENFKSITKRKVM